MLTFWLSYPGDSKGLSFLYEVYEGDSGLLEWRYCEGSSMTKKPIAINHSQLYTGTPVTESESEALTGLHYPASMDRLRELVQEAR